MKKKFTGLKDRHGKKIYEGDKIKVYYQGLPTESIDFVRNDVVKWENNKWNIEHKGWSIGIYLYEVI